MIIAFLAGGIFSWFSSTYPDGLEWSIDKVHGKGELPEEEHGIAAMLKSLQEKTSFLPDYTFRESKEEHKEENTPSWPAPDMGTSLSGVIGAIIIFGISMIFGFGIRAIRGRKDQADPEPPSEIRGHVRLMSVGRVTRFHSMFIVPFMRVVAVMLVIHMHLVSRVMSLFVVLGVFFHF